MLYLRDNDFINLNPKGKSINANCAVIAVGTGLGEGILFYDGNRYHPIAGEGGHCDFAPTTQLQNELLQWLQKYYPQHVSIERILSGSGIYSIYKFLLQKKIAPPPYSITRAGKDEDKSALITKCALEDNDLLCIKTLELFSQIYGAEAGNLALKSLSLGGVYIGGGIAPKILPILQKHFMDAFKNKGRFKNILSNMQVKVSINNETALIGAGYFAKLKHNK